VEEAVVVVVAAVVVEEEEEEEVQHPPHASLKSLWQVLPFRMSQAPSAPSVTFARSLPLLEDDNNSSSNNNWGVRQMMAPLLRQVPPPS
jgi:hypothetical protein